jgi:hypothetical protein
MKKIWLVLVLQVMIYAAYAQKQDSLIHVQKLAVADANDSRSYSGFTITLIPTETHSYHFDILSDDKSVTHHFQNALPFSAKGIQKRDDAYKIALWIINEYHKTGHWENMIPPHIARQLGVEFNEQMKNK